MTPRFRPNVKNLKDRALSAFPDRFFKAVEGKNVIRVLPSWDPADPDGKFFIDQVLHRGLHLDGRDVTLACRAAMLGEPCPMCELVGWCRQAPGMSDIAKEFLPQLKVMFNVVDRQDNTIKIWSTGGRQRTIILSLIDSEDYADLLHPELGRDLILEATGSGKGRRYPSLQPRIVASPIGIPWETMLTNLQKEYVEAELKPRQEMIQMMRDSFGDKFPFAEIFG